MSQANSEFDDFGGAVEYAQPEEMMSAEPLPPSAPPVNKKGVNIYTIFLFLSFLMLTAGAVRLFMELETYR